MNKYELSEAYIGGPTGTVHGRKRTYGGGGGDSGSSTTVQSIPNELKPLATEYSNQAIDLSKQEWTPYEGQRYADLNQAQNMGLGMTMDRALSGSQTVNNAEGQLNNMIGMGATNPYLDSMYQQAAGNVSNSVNSQFANAGRYGSGAHTEALTKGLGDMATNLYGGAYEADRGRQMQAIGMAPTFGNQAYQDASQMLNAGQVLQDQQQQNLDFGYQQYQDQQNDPYKKLAAMSGVFGSNLGSTSTTTSSGGGK